MAGTPIAPFCANLYLREMDAWFERRGALYARYSDDVVFFGSEREIAIYREAFEGFLEKYRLRVNPEKVGLYAPGEPWSFLGFSSHRGVIDIAPATVKKLLARIRRAARSLYRWRLREGVAAEKAQMCIRDRCMPWDKCAAGVDSGGSSPYNRPITICVNALLE